MEGLRGFILCDIKQGMEETIINGEDAPAGKVNKGIEEMMEAGLHFGHKTSKTHPKMKPFITGVRNTIHIINLEKTQEKLDEVFGVIKQMVTEDKTILLVGTKVQARALVKELAEEVRMPYVTERWIGGLFTNFEEVSKRLAHLKDLEEKLADQEKASKYTKWERHEMAEEIKKLEKKFGGVRSLEKKPDAMLMFDIEENQIAVREAKIMGVKIIAIADTNTNPTQADYIIPANNDAVTSMRYLVDKIKGAFQKTI